MYSAACRWTIAPGSWAARAGRRGTFSPPLATITQRASRLPPIRAEEPPIAFTHHAVHLDAGSDRAPGPERIETLDDLTPGEVRVGVLLTQHRVHEPRIVDAHGFPPLGTPSLPDPDALQNHMVDAVAGQGRARGQSRRSRPDHHTVEHHHPLRLAGLPDWGPVSTLYA
ncbi:hypothetical protein GCM10023081_13220 [Arthrobacter ginkgonis]|uniref:Uncharacterized protein n=1 Tax=Arthrobacter ginkgonis TaxID=1630594 RepID=A0ABP7C4L6_9MICC